MLERWEELTSTRVLNNYTTNIKIQSLYIWSVVNSLRQVIDPFTAYHVDLPKLTEKAAALSYHASPSSGIFVSMLKYFLK